MSSNTARVTMKWNDSNISLMNQKAVKGLFSLGFDIAKQARKNAPYVTGALRNTIRVQETSDKNTLEIIAGGSWSGFDVDYAYIREQGPNKNPMTEHYMENAAKMIMTGDYVKKYFGDLT